MKIFNNFLQTFYLVVSLSLLPLWCIQSEPSKAKVDFQDSGHGVTGTLYDPLDYGFSEYTMDSGF